MIMEDNNVSLPSDIIHDILKRLPVKSLLRFQCVCKDWKNMLKDPFLVAEHLQQSRRQTYLIFRQHNDHYMPFELLSLESNIFQTHKIDPKPLIHYLSHSKDDDASIDDFKVIGSINGLLCVRQHLNHFVHPTLFLWNPATKEIIKVPKNNDGLRGDWNIGFGFSAIANDYKIISIHISKSYSNEESGGVQVYSLNTGAWRKVIEFGTIEGVHLFPFTTTVCYNGAIFWVGKNHPNKREEVLISFDIETEVFTLVPLPPSHCGSFIPTIYDNKLALLQFSSHMTTQWEQSGRNFIYLWVIENTCQKGGRWSWIKIYGCEPIIHPDYLLTPMNIWRNEIVCNFQYDDELGNCRFKICSLNPNSNEVNMFAINANWYFCNKGLSYVESLVPVPRRTLIPEN